MTVPSVWYPLKIPERSPYRNSPPEGEIRTVEFDSVPLAGRFKRDETESEAPNPKP